MSSTNSRLSKHLKNDVGIHEGGCNFCKRSTKNDDSISVDSTTCGSCNPQLSKVLDVYGEDGLYFRTNYHGQMQLYRDVHQNPFMDELVWSDRRDSRVITLFRRLDIEEL